MAAKEVIGMIAEILIAISVIVGAIYFITSWCVKTTRRIDRIDMGVGNLSGRMDKMEVSMDKIEVRMDKMEVRMDGLEMKMDDLPERIEDRLFGKFLPFLVNRIIGENNPLPQHELMMRNQLLVELNNNTLQQDGADELKRLLDIERKHSVEYKEYDLTIAIDMVTKSIDAKVKKDVV